MRRTNLSAEALALALLPVLAVGQPPPATRPHDPQELTAPQAQRIDAIRDDIARLKDSVSEVRRDELNYQIERDLLKETYASNLQTINVVIAFVFGVVTLLAAVLGYLGIKNLRAVRDEFARELGEFRSARTALEQRMAGVIAQTDAASERLTKLAAENQSQDERLKYLELMEKISGLYGQGRFDVALKYLDMALAIQPDDDNAIFTQAACYLKLQRLDDALRAYQSVLSRQPAAKDDAVQRAAQNAAEVVSLIRPLEEAARFVQQYGTHIVKRPLLLDYLASLQCARRNDAKGLRDLILKVLPQVQAGAKSLGAWGFGEVRAWCASRGDSECIALLLKLVGLLEGAINPDALRTELSARQTG